MGLGLDLTGVSEQGTPLPDGNYPTICNKAEVSPTKSGGEMIKVQYKITEGPQTGRVIFDQFNIKNANPQAVQIGLGQLKGFMKAAGHPNPNRLESATELQGLKVIVKVKTLDNNDGYGPQARVRGYGPVAGQAQAQAPQAADNNAAQNPVAGVQNPF